MQATVAVYDEHTKGGIVVLDDGTPLAFTADVVADSGLRRLRRGQRVTVQRTGASVTQLAFPGASG